MVSWNCVNKSNAQSQLTKTIRPWFDHPHDKHFAEFDFFESSCDLKVSTPDQTSIVDLFNVISDLSTGGRKKPLF